MSNALSLSAVLDRMRGSVEVVLALALVLLIRLSGGSFSLQKHLVLGPLSKVDPEYLDSLVEHLCLPGGLCVELCAGRKLVALAVSKSTRLFAATLVLLVFDLRASLSQVVRVPPVASCPVFGCPCMDKKERLDVEACRRYKNSRFAEAKHKRCIKSARIARASK